MQQADIGKTGSCHLFRHAMATVMLESGTDTRYIQEMLGHTKIDTTQVSIRQLKRSSSGQAEPQGSRDLWGRRITSERPNCRSAWRSNTTKKKGRRYTPLAYNVEITMVIIETPIFTRLIKALMSDDDYRSLQEALVQRPDTGAIIQGSGGLRKVRWSLEGTGKSGGVRVIY